MAIDVRGRRISSMDSLAGICRNKTSACRYARPAVLSVVSSFVWQASASGNLVGAVKEVFTNVPVLLVGLIQALFEGAVPFWNVL
jgi:hypothetical protein